MTDHSGQPSLSGNPGKDWLQVQGYTVDRALCNYTDHRGLTQLNGFVRATDIGADRKYWLTVKTKLADLNFVVCLGRSALLNSGPFCLEFCAPPTHPALPQASAFLPLPPRNSGARLQLMTCLFLSRWDSILFLNSAQNTAHTQHLTVK